ncbi:MAG TPA: AMP-binding protein [Candidatus Sulfotelmatobacter sp.]|nr:AMP-binding protein [Candidatus Sulfotelmatobacter sp.]
MDFHSLAGFLVEQFRSHRDECAYRQRRGYRTESFTYGKVLDLASRFANELDRRQIFRGDRVMIWGANSAEWVAAFFGCVLRGVVVVPMDDAASLDFVIRVAQQVDAKLLVAAHQHAEECTSLAVPTLVLEDIESALADPAAGNELYEEPASVPGRGPGVEPHPEIQPNAILQIVFTSGTTADPKGVVITHANVLANIAPVEQQIRRYLKYERLVHPIRFLNLLPLSHVFGQFLGMYLPPVLGGTVIFQEELKPSEIVNTIQRERVSVLVSVPRVLQSLKQKIERDFESDGRAGWLQQRLAAAKEKHFLRRWWTFRKIHKQFGWKFWAFISGGAALDPETEEFWRRLGYAVIQGYGLTETTSLISLNHPFRTGQGSIGKVLAGREVKLAPDGEILVRGGGVASGYWDIRGAHAVSDAEGWYRTGDIGELDTEGNLYFKGRKKEVIVTPAGMNVYPDDLEAALRRQTEVKDCVVVGVERGGNAEPCAVLILRNDGNAEQAVRRANESLAEFQRMRMWIAWPEEDFPRTSTQKPKRALIAKLVQERMQASSASTSPPNARDRLGSGNELANLIEKVSGRPATNLSGDASLDSDLGLSSLDRVELLGALEDRYQVDLSEARFSSVRTIGDLEKMLHGEATAGKGYHYPHWSLRWPVTWLRLLAHYLLMRPAILLLGWPRIEGRENLRGMSGPLLVISNHIDHVDPGFILTALPARFRNHLATAAGGERLESLRSPAPDRNLLARMYDRTKWAMGVSLLNLFPLPRESGFRRSFAYAGEAVDRGYSVLVFPEGRHTTDGKMNPFRSGIGLLAQNLGIPVLPMRIDGLFERKQAGKKFAPPWTIRVRIGKPIKFSSEVAPEAIAAELQRAVAKL